MLQVKVYLYVLHTSIRMYVCHRRNTILSIIFYTKFMYVIFVCKYIHTYVCVYFVFTQCKWVAVRVQKSFSWRKNFSTRSYKSSTNHLTSYNVMSLGPFLTNSTCPRAPHHPPNNERMVAHFLRFCFRFFLYFPPIHSNWQWYRKATTNWLPFKTELRALNLVSAKTEHHAARSLPTMTAMAAA